MVTGEQHHLFSCSCPRRTRAFHTFLPFSFTRYCELQMTDRNKIPAFSKLPWMLALAPCTDFVIHLDADAMLANLHLNFDPWIQFMISECWKQFSCALMMMRCAFIVTSLIPNSQGHRPAVVQGLHHRVAAQLWRFHGDGSRRLQLLWLQELSAKILLICACPCIRFAHHHGYGTSTARCTTSAFAIGAG